MGDPGTERSPLRRFSTDDIDRIQEASAAAGWKRLYLQYDEAPLGGVWAEFALPNLLVTREVLGRGFVACAGAPSAFTPILIPMRASDNNRLNGRPYAAGDILSPGNANEVAVAAPEGADIIALQIYPEASRNLSALLGYDSLHDSLGSGFLRLQGATRQRKAFRDLLASLLQKDDQHQACSARSAAALAGTALERLAKVLEDLGSVKLRTHPARHGKRAHYARQARAYLEANLDRAVPISELAGVTAASSRTIHYAFNDIYGLSPQAYHRLRRLSAVHRILEGRGPDETSVTEVAFDHGFWHLSRFSRAYRERFGELPSETLARP